jgi:hypothetical protein
VIHTSGIHGVEGYTGSAIQLRILKELNSKTENIPNIMLVHAMNPHGMKHMQRVNANNVDLNRNSILNNDFTSDSLVFKNGWLNSLINPSSIIEFYLFPFLLLYALFVYGLKTCVQLIVTGQYQQPTAMSYGGVEHEPEIKEFYKAIAPFFNKQSRITHIDLHTGFGKYMNEYLMVDTREEQNYFEQFFKADARENANSNYYINSEFPEYKHMKGGLINGFQQLLAFYGNVQIESYHGMVQEFGTVNFSGIPIFINMRLANFIKYHKSFLFENAHSEAFSSAKSNCSMRISLRYARNAQRCKPGDDKQLQKKMYESFNPPSAEYQEQCIVKGWKRFSELLLP